MIKPCAAIFAAISLLLGALTNAASAQGTAEQRAACMMDAMMLCPHAIPNVRRITNCLGSQLSQLSPRCRAQFVRPRKADR
jgi:hypothetical protein